MVLQEYASPSSEHELGAGTSQAPALALALETAGSDREAASLKRDAPSEQPVVVIEPPAPAESELPVAKPGVPAADPADDLTAPAFTSLSDVLAAAARLRAEGEAGEAEQVLRAAMQRSNSAREVARAGLFLAPLTSDLAERRQLLTAALRADVVIGPEYDDTGRMLRELNHSPLASLHPLVGLARYTVVAGDNLWTLCHKGFPSQFGVSPEVGLVKLVNGLAGDTLRVGQVLLVPTDSLRIDVQTHQHGLTAWLGDVALASYRVGLGKEGRTPRTRFTVQVKQEDPPWFSGGRIIPHGDPENVLGSRWLGFDDQPGASGFGIHGTTDPESIGKDRSMGCIRLRNQEVEELFEYVARGTTVTIL